MIQDRRIEEWRNPIAAEADRPNRSAADMKAIFDSNSNELKEAFNGLIDDLMAGSATVSFEPASVRENISAADTLAVILGKLAKFFTDAQVALNVVHVDSSRPNRFLSENGTYAVPDAGVAANGLPAGGTAGMHLVKAGADDFDAVWVNMTPGDIGAARQSVAVNVNLIKSAWVSSGAGYTQTATVPGVFAASNIIVSASVADAEAYSNAGIRAVAQETSAVTFYADAVPDNNVGAVVLIVG